MEIIAKTKGDEQSFITPIRTQKPCRDVRYTKPQAKQNTENQIPKGMADFFGGKMYIECACPANFCTCNLL
jgi:hypothetical protein